MLTPRSETNLSQRRRSQSLAVKYLLRTQRDFCRYFHRRWVQHQRIKASNATPFLIVQWSCDSINRRETTKQMIRLHFVNNLLGRSHCLRTTPNQLLKLQQFLGVTLVRFILSDNLRCCAWRLSLLFSSNSLIRDKSLAAKKITVSCWQVFARNTKIFLSQLSQDLGLASENQSFKQYTPLNSMVVL